VDSIVHMTGEMSALTVAVELRVITRPAVVCAGLWLNKDRVDGEVECRIGRE
jgi:hypothetical protein